ncbi:MAG: hypothetical protein EA394_04950 [Bacteroidia bacterium]|nr:MAG: hypothetical protein EA394_04950 [Bacteroidia bacterium]
MKRIHFFSVLLLILMLIPSCSQKDKRPFYEADISDIDIDDVRISRYEEVLFNLNPFIIKEELIPYHDEFYFFLGEGIHEPEGQQQLYNYVTDPFLIELYLDSKDIWSDLSELRSSLNRVFRFYKYHFADEAIPRIYTYISGVDYNPPVIYADGHLVMALDKYLGADYIYYDQLKIPRYLSRWMFPEMLPADVVRALADKHLEAVSPEPRTLLDHMIHAGKKQFFIDCMLPRIHDSLKISYTGSQLEWISGNEGFVWAYKLDNELLYSTDQATIQLFLGKAPFTSAFSRQSAPQTGVWIGWQIVRDYMRRNPEITLQELIKETDARKILTGARYRPGR